MRKKRIAKKSLNSKKKKMKKISKKEINKNYKVIARIDLDSKLTKKQIVEHIKATTKIINAAYSTMNEASKLAVEKTVKVIGKGRGQILGTHITGKKKEELLKQSKVLLSIVKGDGTSKVAETFNDLRTERAYESFIKSPFGKDVSREEYEELMKTSTSLSDLFEKFGSEQVHTLLMDFSEESDIATVGEIMKETYEENKGKGLTKRQMLSAITKALKNM